MELPKPQVDPQPVIQEPPKPIKKDYKMRLVKESFQDGYKVKSGQTFYKTWTLLNDGQHPWP